MDVRNYLIKRLPDRFQDSVRIFSCQNEITEIRLRTGSGIAAVTPEGNFLLGAKGVLRRGESPSPCASRDLAETISRLCKGSGYRYFDTLLSGYLTLDCGIRIGFSGERSGNGSRLPEVLISLNIRIPSFVDTAADPFLNAPGQEALCSSLVLSPPGGGKTTFLRALSQRLSRGYGKRKPLRVAVIDERKELFPAILSRGNCDVLSGVSKAEGIDQAIRLFSPQILVCDEIGNKDDIAAILDAGSSGVIFFASCHASSKEEAISKPGIRSLLESGIFQKLVCLTPLPGKRVTIETRVEELC